MGWPKIDLSPLFVLLLAVPALAADLPPKPKVWRSLAPFASAREFNHYQRRGHSGDASELEAVIVTGYRASLSSSRNTITNNQVAGVDEGDIVKAFGRFLVVLAHGRLFSIDTGAQPGELTLVDRVNAYQSASVDSWIDELLIQEDVLIVTGYSYEVDASVISLFRIGRDGVFQPLARYFIESNDYYSGDNYASRIVDGRLVIYSPIDIQYRSSSAALPIPRIRSWTEAQGYSQWRPLFHITDVYRPIQATLYPALHVISVCPILPGQEFQCESTGIVGPRPHEMYVARHHAYLWLTASDDVERSGEPCEESADWLRMRSVPSAVYRFDIPGGDLTAVHTQGEPQDQFAFAEQPGAFWGLVKRPPRDCEFEFDDPRSQGLALAKIPTNLFSTRPVQLSERAWFEMPGIESDSAIRSQYSDGYLLFGTMQGHWRAYAGDTARGEGYTPGKLAVIPLADPRAGRALPLSHSIERIELFGAHALAFGYQGFDAFTVSSIALDAAPHVADTYVLHGVAESEGRSHAFNGLAQADGSGIFGLPTVDLANYRKSARDDVPADVSFLTADAALRLAPADALRARLDLQTGDYRCEVSCLDWYGNSRPIFDRDRIFALTGLELIEGVLRGGRIAEVARVNLAAAARGRSAFSGNGDGGDQE